MKKQVKIPAEVLEQLDKQYPHMAEEIKSLMDDEGRIAIRDEVWNREKEEERETKDARPELPKVVETGLTISDLLRWKRKE